MPKAGGRGGAQTAKSALETDYLSVSLGNPEMIKRLKVLEPRPETTPRVLPRDSGE
jgi:hypothetical protein